MQGYGDGSEGLMVVEGEVADVEDGAIAEVDSGAAIDGDAEGGADGVAAFVKERAVGGEGLRDDDDDIGIDVGAGEIEAEGEALVGVVGKSDGVVTVMGMEVDVALGVGIAQEGDAAGGAEFLGEVETPIEFELIVVEEVGSGDGVVGGIFLVIEGEVDPAAAAEDEAGEEGLLSGAGRAEVDDAVCGV